MATVSGVQYRTESVTISSSGTTSTALDTQMHAVVGILMPAAITGTSFSFQTSHDNSTFQALNNTQGTAVACTVAASKNIAILPADLSSWPYLKVVSNQTESSGRTIQFLLRVV